MHHHAADLWDVELEVDADVGVEIWVDAAPLEIFDGIWLVSIQLQEANNWVIWVIYLGLFDLKPLLESALERDLFDFQALFTAATAAKEIIARAKESPAAPWLLDFFIRNVNFMLASRFILDH